MASSWIRLFLPRYGILTYLLTCSGRGSSPAQVSAALKRARRRNIPGKADTILAALRSEQLTQPPALTTTAAAADRSLIAVISAINERSKCWRSR